MDDIIFFELELVFSTEIMNSSIVRITDWVSTERDDHIRDITDLGSAAVLVCAIVAAIIGLIVSNSKIWVLSQIGR